MDDDTAMPSLRQDTIARHWGHILAAVPEFIESIKSKHFLVLPPEAREAERGARPAAAVPAHGEVLDLPGRLASRGDGRGAESVAALANRFVPGGIRGVHGRFCLEADDGSVRMRRSELRRHDVGVALSVLKGVPILNALLMDIPPGGCSKGERHEAA